ncbi:MAG: HD domain-containing protein, partial [Bacillati bacterium ANGP1]
FTRADLLVKERFRSYYAAPLVAKGQVEGVLEVFHRGPFEATTDWLDFLVALAGQAAIAVDNVTLFSDVQTANMELKAAYDNTLEGWVRALDLRDKETEGHTQRVTDLTVRLARALDVPEADLLHVYRGALLHDIGKMAIPDAVLLKPGPLTPQERQVIERHPGYAYEFLSSIPYLRPALDIPYCHHEKWDGTGYPRGLKGEQIPLVARIFAVADVWDALRSDRPYRKGWSDEQALQYIREQSGTHFDPKVAGLFLKTEPLRG